MVKETTHFEGPASTKLDTTGKSEYILSTMSNDACGMPTSRPASISKPMKPRYAKIHQGAALGLAIQIEKNMKRCT